MYLGKSEHSLKMCWDVLWNLTCEMTGGLFSGENSRKHAVDFTDIPEISIWAKQISCVIFPFLQECGNRNIHRYILAFNDITIN